MLVIFQWHRYRYLQWIVSNLKITKYLQWQFFCFWHIFDHLFFKDFLKKLGRQSYLLWSHFSNPRSFPHWVALELSWSDHLKWWVLKLKECTHFIVLVLRGDQTAPIRFHNSVFRSHFRYLLAPAPRPKFLAHPPNFMIQQKYLSRSYQGSTNGNSYKKKHVIQINMK